MITRVKFLLEELAKFNPEGSLYYSVEVYEIAGRCRITTEGDQLRAEENKELDERRKELELIIQRIDKVLKSRQITEAQAAFDDINALIIESEAT